MGQKVLVLNGNPNLESYGSSLCDAYVEGARNAGGEVHLLSLGQLSFDVNLPSGYRDLPDLEPDIVHAIDRIRWADHMVWVHPLWWYGYPAIMKGFIDRTFLPGVTFKFSGGALPEKLLHGKTGRIITTADTPGFFYRWLMRSPAENQLKRGTLEFCGVSPVRTTYIAPLRKSTLAFRESWLRKVRNLGEKLA